MSYSVIVLLHSWNALEFGSGNIKCQSIKWQGKFCGLWNSIYSSPYSTWIAVCVHRWCPTPLLGRIKSQVICQTKPQKLTKLYWSLSSTTNKSCLIFSLAVFHIPPILECNLPPVTFWRSEQSFRCQQWNQWRRPCLDQWAGTGSA